MYGLDVYKQMDRRLRRQGWKQQRRNGDEQNGGKETDQKI